MSVSNAWRLWNATCEKMSVSPGATSASHFTIGSWAMPSMPPTELRLRTTISVWPRPT